MMKLYAVIAGNAAQFKNWLRDQPGVTEMNLTARRARLADGTIAFYPWSPEALRGLELDGYCTYGTAWRRADYDEIVAIAKTRVRPCPPTAKAEKEEQA